MDKVAKLYQKSGYWSQYGSDVAITVVILGGIVYWVSYSSLQSILVQIRADWQNKRCNPLLMPFAGWIVPVEGQSTFGTTAENLEYCIHLDAGQVVKVAMIPFELILYAILEAMDLFIEALKSFMDFIAWMKSQLGGYLSEVYNKILSMLVPIISMLLKVRDTLGKINGTIAVMLYTIMDVYNITVSGVLNVGNIIISLLLVLIIALVAMIIFAFIMMFIPFMGGIGVAMLSVVVGIMSITLIPIIIIYTTMNNFNQQVLKVSSGAPPNSPSVSR